MEPLIFFSLLIIDRAAETGHGNIILAPDAGDFCIKTYPLFISVISRVAIPLAICFILQKAVGFQHLYIRLAILAGRLTRCLLNFSALLTGKMAKH